MVVASLLCLASVGILLAAEVVLATAISGFVLLLMGVFGISLLALAAFGVFVFISWRLVIAGLHQVTSPGILTRRLSEGDPVYGPVQRVGKSLWEPPSIRDRSRGLTILAGAGVGLILVQALGQEVFGPSDVVAVSIASGTLIVVGYTAWLIRDELHSTGSIRTQLEDEYDLISDPEREQDVSRRLQRLAAQANCQAPAVEIGASRLPQAATVGYRPQNSVVLVSQGLLDSLDDQEIDTVLAHELAHLLNRDAAVLTALSFPRVKAQGFVHLTQRVEGSDGDVFLFPLLLLAAPIYVVNRLVVPTVTRYREYVADQAAAELTGNPTAMASALSTLDREYTVRSPRDLRVQWSTAAFGIVPPPWEERKFFDRTAKFLYRRLLGTHPPTDERIERLQTQIE